MCMRPSVDHFAIDTVSMVTPPRTIPQSFREFTISTLLSDGATEIVIVEFYSRTARRAAYTYRWIGAYRFVLKGMR